MSTANGIYIAPLQLDDDGLPRTTIAVRVVPAGQEAGWVVGEIALEELWRDGRSRPRRHAGIRAARRRGPAPDRARQSEQEASRRVERAATGEKSPEQDFAAQAARRHEALSTDEYHDADGREMLAAGAVVPEPALGRHRRTADRRSVRARDAGCSGSCSSPSASRCSARSSSAGSGAAPSSPASSR